MTHPGYLFGDLFLITNLVSNDLIGTVPRVQVLVRPLEFLAEKVP
jgi:hypothetical protein